MLNYAKNIQNKLGMKENQSIYKSVYQCQNNHPEWLVTF